MNAQTYRFTIEELEGHYDRQFGKGDTRSKLLNAAFEKIRGCSDAAIMRAADSLMLRNSHLPALETLISEILEQNQVEARRADEDQQRKVEDLRGGRENEGPLPEIIKEMLDGLSDGTITRRDWIANLEVLDAQSGTTYAKDYIDYLGKLSKVKNTDLDSPIIPSWQL